MRLEDQFPGIKIFREKLDAGRAADPHFYKRYMSGEIDIDGRLVPRSPATVTRLKQKVLKTGRIAYRADSPTGPTASFLGGSPDQSAALEWPSWEGRKLSFLAQIDLAELHNGDHLPWLPMSGKLLFFVGQNEYDEHTAAISRVIHVPVADPPGEVNRDLRAREYVSFEQRMTFAPLESEDDPGQVDDRRDFEDWYCGLRPPLLPRWQVGGWPRPLQGEMRYACEREYRSQKFIDLTPENASDLEQALDTWHLIGQFEADGLLPGFSEFERGFFWVKVENGQAQFDRAILLGQSD